MHSLSDADILGTSGGWNQGGPNGPQITRDRKGGTTPGGGTSTTWDPTPGAVPNMPDADTATQLEQLGKLLPGGALVTAAEIINGGPLMGDPGKQHGWQPDRFKGKANLTGTGDPGSASGVSASEREIPGQRFPAPVEALVGDEAPNPYLPPEFSDVVLQDRRQPYESLDDEQKRRKLLAMV
jgi:hypothetical protein